MSAAQSLFRKLPVSQKEEENGREKEHHIREREEEFEHALPLPAYNYNIVVRQLIYEVTVIIYDHRKETCFITESGEGNRIIVIAAIEDKTVIHILRIGIFPRYSEIVCPFVIEKQRGVAGHILHVPRIYLYI